MTNRYAMTELDVKAVRDALQKHLPYDIAKFMKDELHKHAKENYKPKCGAAVYLDFLNRHDCTFEKEHPQATNFPYYFKMFSVISQHVYGDCIEECLDQALQYEKEGGKKLQLWQYDEKNKYFQKPLKKSYET